MFETIYFSVIKLRTKDSLSNDLGCCPHPLQTLCQDDDKIDSWSMRNGIKTDTIPLKVRT